MKLVKIPTTRSNPGEGVRKAVAHNVEHWNIAPADIERFVHRHDRGDQRRARAQGAPYRAADLARFQGRAGDRAQMRHAMYDLVLKPETPVFLAPGFYRREVPSESPPTAAWSRRSTRRRRARGSTRWSRPASPRSRSASCSHS
ncbi:MAG: hypothetical protein WDO24_02625 [Pseudomonadota bacterium]